MALTKLVKGMIATGAVTPTNIESTSTFSFNKVSTAEVVVPGSSGFKITSLRNSTSTFGIYYNNSTNEITYGPAATGGSSFNQDLNTTDRVTFAGVAATTATLGATNISNLRINNAFTMPTTAGTLGQVLATNGSTATWVTPVPLNSNQALYTTSSPTFANLTLTSGNFSANTGTFGKLVLTGPLQFSDGSTQSSAVTANQPLNTTSIVSFTGVTATSITVKAIKAVPGSSANRIIIGGEGNIPNNTGWGLDLIGPVTIHRGYTSGDIVPAGVLQGLGTASARWSSAYINTLFVSKNTIYFEDVDTDTTSTLSISTGTMYVDGTALVDQAVTTASSPTFSSINGTTSTFEDIIVSSELFFGDDSVQTTAFNGNQALYNTSTVAFGAMTVTNSATVGALVFSSDGLPINSRSELIGPQGPQGDPGQSSSLFDYKAKTGIYTNDPGTGNMLWNNATQTSATALHFNHVDNLGDDIEYLLSFHQVGDLLRIQNKSNSEQYQVWQISAPITVNTGTYISMPVSLVSSTHSFGNNDIVAVIFRSAGADQSLNTTSNVTFNSVKVSANVQFPDATTQTTAWTGSVSTSSVTGLATVGWSGNYNDLSNRPSIASSDQALFTTSSVRFSGLALSTGTVVQKVVSSGGFPLNSAGTASVYLSTGGSPSLVVSNSSGSLVPNIYVRAFGQNRPAGGATTQGNPVVQLESSRGTNSAPTAVQANDSLGAMVIGGFDGANWMADTGNATNLIGYFASENWTNSGSTTLQAGSNFHQFIQPAWTRPGSNTTRQRMQITSWTTSSTGPSQLNWAIGSGVDGTAPTMTMVDGTTYTGYGRANIGFSNASVLFTGVPSADSAPDNATLTSTNVVTILGNRRSGATGRRNPIVIGDNLGVIQFNGQSASNSTGVGVTGASITTTALDNFSGGTTRGTNLNIATVNSGTAVTSSRLSLSDRFNVYASNSHNFYNKDQTQQYLSIDPNGITVGTGTNTALIAGRSGQNLQLTSGGGSVNGGLIELVSGGGVNISGGSGATIAALSTSTANFYGNIKIGNTWTLPATDGTSGQVLATNGSGAATWTDPSITSVYARSALPSGTTGRIITISDSGSDTNAPAGNYAPAYWDPDASVWTYIGNSNSVTPI